MPRSSAYDHGRYAFLAGKLHRDNPYRNATIDEAIDWTRGFEREAAEMVQYREEICHAGNIR